MAVVADTYMTLMNSSIVLCCVTMTATAVAAVAAVDNRTAPGPFFVPLFMNFFLLFFCLFLQRLQITGWAFGCAVSLWLCSLYARHVFFIIFFFIFYIFREIVRRCDYSLRYAKSGTLHHKTYTQNTERAREIYSHSIQADECICRRTH